MLRARGKANVSAFVWRAEQIRFHAWLIKRMGLTLRDIDRINAIQRAIDARFARSAS